MINIVQQCTKDTVVYFYQEACAGLEKLPASVRRMFAGEYLQTAWMADVADATGATDMDNRLALLVGTGKPGREYLHLKELGAKAAKECKSKKIYDFSINIENIINEHGLQAVRHIAEGIILGVYTQRQFKETEKEEISVELYGIPGDMLEEAQALLEETVILTEGVCFARDMVNLPGNRLRPADFAAAVLDFVKDTGIQAELLDEAALKEKGMHALLGVGESSAYPPCLLVLRYQGDPNSTHVTGLVGKGVTCDTGGYCLKPSGSMLGIKGDMAGGAAVCGALYALAKNHVRANAVAVVPMCENRISSGSLLPGDVIGSYAGKTIEIANTDAEGRLILADAVSYAVREENATEILDIATLTGAVVSMLGFTVGGAICDEDGLYERFYKAYACSGERYWRLPFYEEYEKMIESKIADIRNLSSKGCGTITAGLFIRAFAEGRPWLHLDIAGTAWVDEPAFEFQTAGATGAGVTSIYQLCRGENM